MNKSILIVALAGSAAVASAQSLAELIVIDLSVVNQVTLTATDGASAVSESGSDGIGIYFENFYAGDGSTFLNETLISGDITNFENPSDGSPNLFRSGTTDPGLNLFSFSSDSTVTFTAGGQAFTGSAVFSLEADDYADMIALGNRSGNIWFPADDDGDLAGASVLGTYTVIVPAPAAFSAFALGLGATALRRRR